MAASARAQRHQRHRGCLLERIIAEAAPDAAHRLGEGLPRAQVPVHVHHHGHGGVVVQLDDAGDDPRRANAFSIAGSQLESDWIPRLEAALGLGVDIFHLTIATHSRHDLPLNNFRVWLRHLREYTGAVCVVAAGNDGDRRPTWPAACSEVVSVGALGRDWRSRATFSNFGSWVDLYAPGTAFVNAYATGTYTCHVSPYQGEVRTFCGMAQWSGTSFSTPIVTGLIASRMSRTGENARRAAAAVLAEAQAQAIPGVGPVLLPCCRDADPRRCCGAGHRHCCAGGSRHCCGGDAPHSCCG